MKFLIIKNLTFKKCDLVVSKFTKVLMNNNIDYKEYNVDFLNDETNYKDIKDKYNLIVTFGGDGTIISATKLAHFLNTPIMGINLGHIGFLTSITEKDDFKKIVSEIKLKRYFTDKRSLIKGDVYHNNKKIYSSISINDITIASSLYSKMGKYDLYLDDYLFNEYNSDGLIISTVTGATGHTLSAGGPIVSPKVPAFIITAICPHALNQRSLVVSNNTSIEIVINNKGQVCDYDGREQIKLEQNDKIKIKKYNKYITFINFDKNFLYNSIKNKIKLF